MPSLELSKTWMQYAERAWRLAGMPRGLEPARAVTDPLDYDRAYYHYFEERYADHWKRLFERLDPASIDPKLIPVEFHRVWRRHFEPRTVWKQLLPLFVFADALGGIRDTHVGLAEIYAVAQAIPSMIVDRLLDESMNNALDPPETLCFLSRTYIWALEHVQSLERGDSLARVFIKHTLEMYGTMAAERQTRFVLATVDAASVTEYLNGPSRLVSSVFFSILGEWAFIIANKDATSTIREALVCLRRVRQLNDEISDLHDDLRGGLVTFPWVRALADPVVGPGLRDAIAALWADRTSTEKMQECERLLAGSVAIPEATAASRGFLDQAAAAILKEFPEGDAFGLSVLILTRASVINRVVQRGYRDVPPEERPFPRMPNEMTRPEFSLLERVQVIPGAGALVMDQHERVLMTLILKRGLLRWELPAGICKPSEHLEATAEREVLEETGWQIAADRPIATCWHYSRKLGKGWMGVFFRGVESRGPDEPNPINAQELEVLHARELRGQLASERHEVVFASGFVEWKRLPSQRIHPLHYELLKSSGSSHQEILLLVSDADLDIQSYDRNAPLWFEEHAG